MGKIDYRFGFLVIVFVIGFSGHIIPNAWSMDKKSYENISVDQFVKLMDQKDFTLINVHIPYQGEIEKTDLLIPFNVIDQHKNKLPNDKDARIVVYCMAGHMGYIAAEKLAKMGYNHVIHFQGGMRSWAKNGKQIVYRRN
jgi:rhodanese-related sulfurtransferase